jgi:hypothetical protein
MDKANRSGKAIVKTGSELPMAQYGVKDLTIRIREETKMRALLTKFITDHMKDGTDFGRIHVSRACPDKYKCKYEVNPGHWSKPSLFKPGAEKVSSLFHLRAAYVKDLETWEMAGSIPGLFCYKCELIDGSGAVAGEGRGSCSTTEKQGNQNNAIKIAEKRAKVDAVLSTGALSDFFTQDLEDMNITDDTPIYHTTGKPTPTPKPIASAPVTTPAASNTTCPICHATGKYHRKDCPNFKAAQEVDTPAPVVTNEVNLTDEDVAKIDAMPDKPAVKMIDDVQVARIKALGTASGLTTDVLKDQLKEKYNVDMIKKLTHEQGEQIIKDLTPATP